MNIRVVKLFFAGTVVAMSVTAMPAQAQDSVTASVDARAGLSPILSLSCDGVNFGVWRLPVRSSGGTTTVALTVSANNAAATTTATLGGNTGSVGLAAGYIAPTAGSCFVSGSNNLASTIQATIAGNTAMAFSGSTHNSLSLPVTNASLLATLALAGTGVGINATGNGSFRVIGTLTIPQIILAGNYGGYVTADRAQVTVTDALISSPT